MPSLSRPLIASTALALGLAPMSGGAQTTTWWDLISPDRLIETVVQYGIIALRSQVDLQYGALTVNALAGRVVITDLSVWPLVEWDNNGDCKVTVERAVLQTTRPDTPQRMRFGMSLYGVNAPDACLPEEARPMLAMAELGSVEIPHLSMDLVYDLPSAGADVTVHATVGGLVEADLVADISYLSFDGREDMEEPEPVVFLSSASLTLTNLGGWEVARTMVPPPFMDPDQVPLALQGMLGAALGQMNREAAGEGATGDPSALTPAQQNFVDSAVATWTGFLANPQRLVLETAIPPAEAAFLDFELYEDNPVQLFADLQPVLALAPVAARAALPTDQLRAALAEDATGVPAEDMLRVGKALASGVGAPRAIDAAIRVLTPLAQDGNAEAADALAGALESRAPDQSYRWSLLAGAEGSAGATARLDRLERSLPFPHVLQLQAEASQGVSHPVEALESVSALKAQARARLTGRGALRSYQVAAMWAMIAAAAGDAEGRAILDEIDQRVAAAGPDAVGPWAEAESGASSLALDAWIGRDLPGTYGAAAQ